MMPSPKLSFEARPNLKNGRMVLAFSGWMDGGGVSTGTVEGLISELRAERVAEIDSDGFYIYSFPGDMQTAALFRPHIKIEEGIVKGFQIPRNRFFASEERKLALFVGKEPNLNWCEFSGCIFDFVSELGISSLLFVGSFAGAVPHTREPRLHVSVSEPRLRVRLQKYGLRPTNYEGPGSFMTYLTTQARERDIEMANIAAEIPAYLSGTNPSSIEAVTRRVAAILGLEVDLAKLRTTSNEWERRVSKVVDEDPQLVSQVRQLEEQYDDELIDLHEREAIEGVDFSGPDSTPERDIDDN